MAPNKRYAHKLKVALSHCEMAVLSYLSQQTDESLAEHIRQAILVYARQHPQFDAAIFKFSATRDILRELEDSDLRGFFEAQLDAFTKDAARESSPEDSLPLRLPSFSSLELFTADEED